MGQSQGDSLTNPMLITAFYHFEPEGHREPRNEVGSLSPAERLIGLNREHSSSNHNTLTHYATLP